MCENGRHGLDWITTSHAQSNQLHSSLQLASTDFEIGSGGADKIFQDVDGSAFVQQGKRLCQAVCADTRFDAFLAGKEWVVAIHTLGLCCIRRQFIPQLNVDKTVLA